MSKYFLLPLYNDDRQFNRIHPLEKFTYHHSSTTSLEVRDFVLFVDLPDVRLLPYVFQVRYINRTAGTATLVLLALYNYPLSSRCIDFVQNKYDLRQLILRSVLFSKAQLLTEKVYSLLIDAMGKRRMEEQDFLKRVKTYIRKRGYYFDDETLYNYHICLKTRPFVILAGLSGTGKSKLSQLYAEALGHREHYKRLAVRPNWNDDRYLLGYLNTLTGEYMTEPAVDFLLEAEFNSNDLYLLCLDEMNLAHIEYYFSQFLSAFEEDAPEDRHLTLYSHRLAKKEGDEVVPSKLTIAPNVLFTGTINVDETTQSISDKVIDRANTIEFFHVDLEQMPEPQEVPAPIQISSLTWQSYRALKPEKSYDHHVIAINNILKKANLGLGYRVLREIQMYLANSQGLIKTEIAFDLQIKQRILPRVRGNENISSILNELIEYTKSNHFPRSQKRLEEMKSRLKRDGYTSFWR